jgi:hypothetical protein
MAENEIDGLSKAATRASGKTTYENETGSSFPVHAERL